MEGISMEELYKNNILFTSTIEKYILKTNLYTITFGKNVNSWALLVLIHTIPINIWNNLISCRKIVNYNYAYNIRYDYFTIFKEIKIGWTNCIDNNKIHYIKWQQNILWNRTAETFIPISPFPIDITNIILTFI